MEERWSPSAGPQRKPRWNEEAGGAEEIQKQELSKAGQRSMVFQKQSKESVSTVWGLVNVSSHLNTDKIDHQS